MYKMNHRRDQRERQHQGQGQHRHQGQGQGQQREEPVPVDWATVVMCLRKNPHAGALPPSRPVRGAVAAVVAEEVIDTSSSVASATTAETETLAPSWTQLAVSPSTPLSCVLYALDHNSYSSLSESGRKEAGRVACTELQTRADTALKGRAWPKAKTNEGIVEVAEKEVSPWSPIGLAALAELYGIQMVVLNETDKKIHYIPEDICTWDPQTPIQFHAHNYRSVYRPPPGFGSASMLAWLAEKEADGWTFQSKEVKGTMEELNALAQEHHLTLPPGKLKKDALIAHISRGLAIATLNHWSQATPE
jgi:hypothetical protein